MFGRKHFFTIHYLLLCNAHFKMGPLNGIIGADKMIDLWKYLLQCYYVKLIFALAALVKRFACLRNGYVSETIHMLTKW